MKAMSSIQLFISVIAFMGWVLSDDIHWLHIAIMGALWAICIALWDIRQLIAERKDP